MPRPMARALNLFIVGPWSTNIFFTKRVSTSMPSLPEAFATVREAAKRTLGQRHYDVQLIGGAALLLFRSPPELSTDSAAALVTQLRQRELPP